MLSIQITPPLRWQQHPFPKQKPASALGTLIPYFNPALKSWAIKGPAFGSFNLVQNYSLCSASFVEFSIKSHFTSTDPLKIFYLIGKGRALQDLRFLVLRKTVKNRLALEWAREIHLFLGLEQIQKSNRPQIIVKLQTPPIGSKDWGLKFLVTFCVKK